MSRLVHRDPFAREELHAKRISDPDRECAYCGQQRLTPKGKRYLYLFWIERDGLSNTISEDNRLFCSRSCRSDYYGRFG